MVAEMHLHMYVCYRFRLQLKAYTVSAIMYIFAERLSARQLILHRILERVSMYVCMYVSVILRNAIILHATRKHMCTGASVVAWD